MDKFFVNIIYYLCYVTFNYYKATFHCFKLFHPTLFMIIYGYYQIFDYLKLFHPRPFSIKLNYFCCFMLLLTILGYFTLGYFLLL